MVAEPATLLLLSAMAFLPAVLLMMTRFTRIIIVLGLLRTAIGTTGAAEPGAAGAGAVPDVFVMSPTLDQAYESAWQPFSG
jgi:flagellar biosynthetic protein FliP